VSATSMGSDMFPTADGSNARTSRRKRRVAIAGALALVVVAGAIIVGVTTTGSRSGTYTSAASRTGCAAALASTTGNTYCVPDAGIDYTVTIAENMYLWACNTNGSTTVINVPGFKQRYPKTCSVSTDNPNVNQAQGTYYSVSGQITISAGSEGNGLFVGVSDSSSYPPDWS
jgi:hypothetical protein